MELVRGRVHLRESGTERKSLLTVKEECSKKLAEAKVVVQLVVVIVADQHMMRPLHKKAYGLLTKLRFVSLDLSRTLLISKMNPVRRASLDARIPPYLSATPLGMKHLAQSQI